ncbi:MAG: hypothetical protein GXP16_16975 [Gammaproteobacteria bacterium]|nr:hypothetical protein [Gammaproteobacteria bacterium]
MSVANPSIVKQLVIKDLKIMKVPAICYWVSGLLSITLVSIVGEPAGTIGFILFVSALFGVGVHAAMQTVTEEKQQQVLPFIMSLPITIRQYTSAKLIGNLILVGGIWATLTAASYVVFIGELLPTGAIPFVTIIWVGILLAYIVILATTLMARTITPAIVAMVGANLVTQALLWWVSTLHGIRSVIGGNVAVWNNTALTVLSLQVASIVLLVAMTYFVQSKKTDFV